MAGELKDATIYQEKDVWLLTGFYPFATKSSHFFLSPSYRNLALRLSPKSLGTKLVVPRLTLEERLRLGLCHDAYSEDKITLHVHT